MKHVFSAIVFWIAIVIGGAAAAQQAWIQVEAHPTLHDAEDRLRDYSARMNDVNGFELVSGWYAIVLGPYGGDTAASHLNELRFSGRVPADSYVVDGSEFRRQIWPVGVVATPPAPETTPETAEPAQPAENPVQADETEAEALQSERALNGDERKALQVALQWEGFYSSAIDGDFGRGTRNAMAAYQASQGFEVTGVLTTRQRAALLDGYQSVIESLGMTTVFDNEAGITISMPAAMVAFSRYEAPFAHYEAVGDSGVRVVLISQKGDQDTLFGLYDIMQTLEVVPLKGPRSRRDSEFTLTGANDRITSYTHARLVDGAVKGFTLVWPAGDEKRRSLALGEMQESFASLGTTALADNAGLDQATQSIDLLSGLEIRRPDAAASGFYVTTGGMVLTALQTVENCARITLDDSYAAQLAASAPELGLALLEPGTPLAPLGVAKLLASTPRLNADIAVAGYSYGGRLGAPTLTPGTLAELTGLHGEAHQNRLVLTPQPGDAGGPVLDTSGAVIGLLLPAGGAGGPILPADTQFAVNAMALAGFLAENGVNAAATDAGGALDYTDLSRMGADMTVLVSCWN